MLFRSPIVQHFSHMSTAVTQDCVSCHTSLGPSGSWLTGSRIHTTIAAASITACNLCHSSDVPPNSATTPYGATNDKYVHSSSYSSYDCKSCHGNQPSTPKYVMSGGATAISPPASNLGVSWAGGIYDHKVGSGKV